DHGGPRGDEGSAGDPLPPRSELIKTLFELEVPEIADGLVEIRGVAREPGYRSKIAVESHAQGVDPVGACVGPRGSRVRMVVSEIAFGGGDAEEFSGRCAAILSNGKRCPNAALPSSQYCGVPAHQALALTAVPDDEEPIVDEPEPELEREAELAPPEAESIGLEALPPPEVSEVDSEAPADVAATHGPDATVIAHDRGEIDP